MYETMAVWDTVLVDRDQHGFVPGMVELEREFASLWRAADKVVFSTTLSRVSTPRTTIEGAIDADRIRRLKANTARDITVGGPHLASAMLAAKLVDEVHVFVHPIIIGHGIPIVPKDVRIPLEHVAETKLGAVTQLTYRVL